MALPVGTGWMTNGEEQDGEQPAYDPNTDPEILKLTDEINSRRWNQPAPPVSSDISGEPEWWSQSPQEFLSDPQNEAIDFHNDPEALDAVPPEVAGITLVSGLSHPQLGSRAGNLMAHYRRSAAIGGTGRKGRKEQTIANLGRA